MIAPRRLPGIRIAVTPPPLAEVLPRMDVAVFAGFAATGPTHRPLAVESVAEYVAVFGDDIALAWDTEQEERVYAHLGPSVRAFFSNGGQRCWVIRVARTPSLEASWRKVSEPELDLTVLASANHFSVPGVLVLTSNGDPLASAQVQARSVGSWSDTLRIASALTVSEFELNDCRMLSSGTDKRIGFTTRAKLQTGDLIELGNAADFDNLTQIRVYAIIDKSLAAKDPGSSEQQVEARLCAAFEPVSTIMEFQSPPVDGTAEVIGIIANMPATLESSLLSPLNASVVFSNTKQLGLTKGQWIRWVGNQQTIWLQIDRFGHRSSQSNPDIVDFIAEGPAWVEQTPMLPIPSPVRASLLSLELQVTMGQGKAFRLNSVGLTPIHRSGWWQQVSDDLFYAAANSGFVSQSNEGRADGQSRFPLAALDYEINQSPPLAWIPLGVTSLYGDVLGPLPQKASALERDGLSRFTAELFLDPELAGLSIDALIDQANVVRYLSSIPRGLFGIHAALSIGVDGLFNEASLIAVPDAVHIGWEKRPDVNVLAMQAVNEKSPAHWFQHRSACAVGPEDIFIDEPDFSEFLDCDTRRLIQPSLDGPGGTVPRGIFLLSWNSPELDVGFILEEAQRADFSNAHEIYRGVAREYIVNALQEGIYYFRVTAFSGYERSMASVVQVVVVRDEAWIQLTPEKFAQDGETTLLYIHRSLLSLASASGELFAVLGLPRHYQQPKALRYASRLRAQRSGADVTDPDGFPYNERRVLSYGALYHPWAVFAAQSSVSSSPVSGGGLSGKPLQMPALGSTQRVCPPDGIASGMLAARAAIRGAWIAPANQSLLDVVALTPQIQEEAWLSLQDAQLNLLRADARGFLTLSADTLADEPELRPINVRRLLILLRRLALRRGTSYVFEPNNDVLRRAVERGFTFLLTDLFRRGAFAGATPAESFLVVTSGTINTNTDVEAGRFFVELRVAPSLPLQFLTIRLTQNGERFTVLEGA